MKAKNKYGLHGNLTAKTGKGEELAAILLASANVLESFEGCYLYMVSREPNNPDVIWVTECWESPEHHQNSLQLEEVRAAIGKAMPLLDGMPSGGMKLEVLGGGLV